MDPKGMSVSGPRATPRAHPPTPPDTEGVLHQNTHEPAPSRSLSPAQASPLDSEAVGSAWKHASSAGLGLGPAPTSAAGHARWNARAWTCIGTEAHAASGTYYAAPAYQRAPSPTRVPPPSPLLGGLVSGHGTGRHDTGAFSPASPHEQQPNHGPFTPEVGLGPGSDYAPSPALSLPPHFRFPDAPHEPVPGATGVGPALHGVPSALVGPGIPPEMHALPHDVHSPRAYMHYALFGEGAPAGPGPGPGLPEDALLLQGFARGGAGPYAPTSQDDVLTYPDDPADPRDYADAHDRADAHSMVLPHPHAHPYAFEHPHPGMLPYPGAPPPPPPSGSLRVHQYGLHPLPRLRTQHACDHCRKRKAKCSGALPVCARCTKLGLTCVYGPRADRPAPRRRRAAEDEDAVFVFPDEYGSGRAGPHPPPHALAHPYMHAHGLPHPHPHPDEFGPPPGVWGIAERLPVVEHDSPPPVYSADGVPLNMHLAGDPRALYPSMHPMLSQGMAPGPHSVHPVYPGLPAPMPVARPGTLPPGPGRASDGPALRTQDQSSAPSPQPTSAPSFGRSSSPHNHHSGHGRVGSAANVHAGAQSRGPAPELDARAHTRSTTRSLDFEALIRMSPEPDEDAPRASARHSRSPPSHGSTEPARPRYETRSRTRTRTVSARAPSPVPRGAKRAASCSPPPRAPSPEAPGPSPAKRSRRAGADGKTADVGRSASPKRAMGPVMPEGLPPDFFVRDPRAPGGAHAPVSTRRARRLLPSAHLEAGAPRKQTGAPPVAHAMAHYDGRGNLPHAPSAQAIGSHVAAHRPGPYHIPGRMDAYNPPHQVPPASLLAPSGAGAHTLSGPTPQSFPPPVSGPSSSGSCGSLASSASSSLPDGSLASLASSGSWGSMSYGDLPYAAAAGSGATWPVGASGLTTPPETSQSTESLAGLGPRHVGLPAIEGGHEAGGTAPLTSSAEART